MAAAVSCGLVAAQVGKLAGNADITGKIHVVYIFWCVEPFDFQVGNSGKALFLVGVVRERFFCVVLPFTG